MTDLDRGRNLLLRAMSDADFALLAPYLIKVDMARGHEFASPDDELPFSWFPLSGIVSVVATTAGGDQAEIGIVGREGMFAVSTLLGVNWSLMHIFAQIPGEVLRIPVGAVQTAMATSASLRKLLLAYAQSFTLQIAGSALAYATQTIEVRLARWLLMSLERIDGPEIPMTHESLSLMLGVRRAGVTVAIASLEARGAVVGRRATIVVADRARLEAVAGDAYGPAERAYARLIGIDATPVANGSATP